MRKSTAIMLIIVLILQMCTGFLVNSNESDRTDMKACEVEEEREYGSRASREEVQDNHTEGDDFGGSWFDDFDDDSGIKDGLDGTRLEADEHTVGLWHFDEGTGNEAKDASGNGNNGTLTNMEEEDWMGGRFGKALEFDGQDDYVDCGKIAGNEKPSLFSIETWIYLKSIALNQMGLVMSSSSGSGSYRTSWGLSLESMNKVQILIGNTDFGGGASYRWYQTSTTLDSNVWYHVAGIYYGGNDLRIYINGLLDSGGTSGGSVNSNGGTNEKLSIGRWGNLDGRYFQGIIDEVRISNVARTPAEIRRNYEGGLVLRNGKVEFAQSEFDPGTGCVGYWSFDENYLDSSDNNNHGTPVGDVHFVEGKYGQAASFDGVDDSANIADKDILSPQIGVNGELTVESWIKPSRFPSSDSRSMIVSKGEDPTGWEYVLGLFPNGTIGWYILQLSGGAHGYVCGGSVTLNNWHHIVGVFKKGNFLQLYVNGISVATTTSFSGSLVNSNSGLYFARKTFSVYWWDWFGGLIDEVAIYNRALSPSEIYQHYTGISYATNATLNSTPIILPENTTWSTLSLSKTEPVNTYIKVSVIDNATNQTIPGYENLTARNIDISNITTESIRLKAWFSGDGQNTPTLDSWGVEWNKSNAWRDSFIGEGKIDKINSTLWRAEDDEYILGLWNFEGNYKDNSINSNDGTPNGDVHFVGGKNGQGVGFDGNGDYVDLGNVLDMGGSFSVAVWMKTTSTSIFRLVQKRGTGTQGSIPGWQLSGSGTLDNTFIDDGNNYIDLYSDASINICDGNWHHIALVWDASLKTGYLYVDSKIDSSDTNVNMNNDLSNNKNLTIGCSWNSEGGQTQFFDGTIDEVRISNITRTPEEIRQAYQMGIAIRGGQAQLAENVISPGEGCVGYWSFDEGSGDTAHDGSGNGNDGTLINMDDSNWVQGVHGGSLKFNGVDNLVEIQNPNNLNIEGGISIEVWMKLKATTPSGTFPGIVSEARANGIFIQASSNRPYYQFHNGNTYRAIISNKPLNLGQWTHIVAVHKFGDYEKIFINGVERGSRTISDPINMDLTKIVIGSSKFSGIIDEVAIYNCALSPSEIYSHSRLYRHNATLRSENIYLPSNHTWNTFHFSRIVPEKTFINISVHDAITNEILTVNRSHNSTQEYIDLSHINVLKHSSIYLQAYFQSNRTETPLLYDWAVNWTPIEPPLFISGIENISIFEETPVDNILEISGCFFDKYSDIYPSKYAVEYVSNHDNITLKVNGSQLNVVYLADNFTGNVSVKVNSTNLYNLTTSSNMFNITVINTNDTPIWSSIPPPIELVEDESAMSSYTLYDYVFDGDGDNLSFNISTPNDNISADVDENGSVIIIPKEDYFGITHIKATVKDQIASSSSVNISVIVTPLNDAPWVELIYPVNGAVLGGRSVTFKWRVFDKDNDLSELYFVLNLSETENPLTHTSDIQDNEITISGLENGKTYYWHIKPTDPEIEGTCLNGTRSFTINTSVSIPEVVLAYPINGTILNTTEVNFTWELAGVDNESVVYELYLGNSIESFRKIDTTKDNWYYYSNLLDNSTYYWRVIPILGLLEGRCVSGTWSFTVNTSFTPVYNITVELDVEQIEIIHGHCAIFNLTLTNTGNMPTRVDIEVSGYLAGFVELDNFVILQVDERETLPIIINNTDLISIGSYELIIEIIYHGTSQTLSLPINITSGEPVIDDDGKKELDSNWLCLLGIALLLIVLAIGIFFILRKKRKEDEEIEDVIDADIVKPGESPFSQPPQVPLPVQQPPQQFAPSVKHASYMPKSDRAVPGAFAIPPQPAKEEIPSVESILAGIKTEAPPIPQTPSAPTEQLPLTTGAPTPVAPTAPPQPIPSGPQIVGIDTQFAISDMFLIYVDGRLVKSVSFDTKLSEGMDEDIMSGMLTAITDFIKDSFNEESGALKTLQYGKMTIYLERGIGMYLAVVFHGQPPHNLREKMRWLLIRLWEKYKLKLKVWDGSYDGLDGLDSMLSTLMGETEPQIGETEKVPMPSSMDATAPIISKATEAVMCNICMGVVKPGLEIMTCNCSNKYHKACGERIGMCPKCNGSLLLSVKPPQPTGEKTQEQLPLSTPQVPLPNTYVPPPPDAPDETKALPEFSGQQAGQKEEFRI